MHVILKPHLLPPTTLRDMEVEYENELIREFGSAAKCEEARDECKSMYNPCTHAWNIANNHAKETICQKHNVSPTISDRFVAIVLFD